MSTLIQAPRPGVLFGITHSLDMTPIVREVRVLKVGIGVPKGRASYVYLYENQWIVRYGAWEKEKLVMKSIKFPNRAATEEWYSKNKTTFAVSNRPQKIPFFTFTRRTLVEINGKPEEIFEPDFAAIEAHGDTPREIDVVFMGDNPLSGEYQAWSATELKCHGDGLNALRLVQLGNDKWPGWKEAVDAKEKYFPVSECYTSGLCPYAQEGGKDKLACKPSATLTFQLANSIRLGATAYFTTTSFRSVRQLFSSLGIIQSIAERAGASIANTPLKLVLAPFRTNHNGIAATQYGVSLELRTQDVQKLRALLAEAAWKPSPPRMIAATEEITDISAAEMTAEFHPDAEPDFDGEEPASSGIAAATDAKTEELGAKLKAKREKTEVKPEVKPEIKPETVNTNQTVSVTVEPAPVPDNPWPKRATDTFLMTLGPDLFNEVMEKTLGTSSLTAINPGNYKKLWEAMGAAKARMAVPVGPDAPNSITSPELAPDVKGGLF